jgi:hypothetical protein
LEQILEGRSHHNRFHHIHDSDVYDRVKKIQFHISDNERSPDLRPILFHEDHCEGGMRMRKEKELRKIRPMQGSKALTHLRSFISLLILPTKASKLDIFT